MWLAARRASIDGIARTARLIVFHPQVESISGAVMQDDLFEWDDRKAASNARKHGVRFDEARGLFDDPFALDDPDDDPDEERWLTIGMSGVDLLVVVYTERGRRKRIISAWKADASDAERYAEHRGREDSHG